jgi:hypothetical protein
MYVLSLSFAVAGATSDQRVVGVDDASGLLLHFIGLCATANAWQYQVKASDDDYQQKKAVRSSSSW